MTYLRIGIVGRPPVASQRLDPRAYLKRKKCLSPFFRHPHLSAAVSKLTPRPPAQDCSIPSENHFAEAGPWAEVPKSPKLRRSARLTGRFGGSQAPITSSRHELALEQAFC